MPKFYRTVVTIEVLSEKPYEFHCVGDIAYDITDGDCSGKIISESSEEVDAPTMAKLLKEHGSDLDFNLDDDGKDK